MRGQWRIPVRQGQRAGLDAEGDFGITLDPCVEVWEVRQGLGCSLSDPELTGPWTAGVFNRQGVDWFSAPWGSYALYVREIPII